MAVDFFLEIDGISGEAQDATHSNTIDILNWSWGMSQSGTTHVGSGSGSGKVSVNDLSVTKYVDKATPALIKHACTGIHISKATLFVRKAAGTGSAIDYIKIEMKDIIVTHIATGGTDSEDRILETVTLNFGEFKYIYTMQNPDGSKGAAPEFAWDIAANTTK